MIHDFVVIGAGIAGASVAYELAEQSRVLIIEAEPQPGYHSTGRSAALFTRNYGNDLVRRINSLSEPFFYNPPAGLVDGPLLEPRGAMSIAAPDNEAELDHLISLSTGNDPIVALSMNETLSMVPFLREERIGRAVFEPGVKDIEVATLLQSYLKAYKQLNGQLVTDERVNSLMYKDSGWTVTTQRNTYRAKTIINAAGAWADEIGALAGATPIGLVAKRRTGIIVDATSGYDVGDLPCIDFVGNGAYIKPDSGKLMASPGDATPTQPQDVQPEEMDVAMLADWIQRETLIPIPRILNSWAGLRSFVADDSPVVGFDSSAPGFFWHAGQGGYGIMMAPALARAAASLCLSGALPDDFQTAGITIDDLGLVRISQA